VARIVLGIGTSHSPAMSMGVEWWPIHSAHFDATSTGLADFDERCAQAPAWLRDDLAPAVLERKWKACNAALDELSRTLIASKPDVVIVVGDDQLEMFPREGVPALAIFDGDALLDNPVDLEPLPPSFRAAMWSIHGPEPVAWPASSELGKYLAQQLSAADFDLTVLSAMPENRTLGHAYTFVFRRLLGALPLMPIVPIFLNTYYPPNSLRADRCWALGEAIRAAVDDWPSDLRVAIIGSGGLSHFLVDVELDRAVLRALGEFDRATVAAIPESRLQSGSSEIKNWIVAGAALKDFTMNVIDYVPGYRSGAGSGIGFAFATWTPRT
jgi:3-O-methylgallate 3,4-dioxygenase